MIPDWKVVTHVAWNLSMIVISIAVTTAVSVSVVMNAYRYTIEAIRRKE